jgi:hypothetical protein
VEGWLPSPPPPSPVAGVRHATADRARPLCGDLADRLAYGEWDLLLKSTDPVSCYPRSAQTQPDLELRGLRCRFLEPQQEFRQ